MTDAKLLPCPFCGNNNPCVISTDWVHVECAYCFARAQRFSERSAAISAWNRRTPSVSPSADCPARSCVRADCCQFERTPAPGVTEEAKGRAAYQVHLASGRHMDMVTARALVDTALTAALKEGGQDG
jgi:hypothetical protein